MQRLFIASLENSDLWDAFVDSHPYGWVCHLSVWQKILEKSFKHIHGEVVVLKDDSTGAIQAGLPVYTVDSWLTGKRLISIPFATICDPLVFSWDQLNQITDYVKEKANKEKASFIEIRTLLSATMQEAKDFSSDSSYKHHFIKLDRKPEDLKKNFDRSCIKQRLDRSLKSGITLTAAHDEAAIDKFYSLHLETRKRLSLPPQPHFFIKNLIQFLQPLNLCQLLFAEKDGETLAGMLLFKYKNRVSAEYAVSNKNFQNISPNHFLFWHGINIAYNEKYEIFDFGQTDPANKGLMDFKKRWGSEIMDIPYFYYPKQNAAAQKNKGEDIKYKLVKKICGVAPDRMLQIIGNFCYRHLG